MVATQFLPERPVPQMEFTYRYYGAVGGMSPFVAENSPTPLASVGYEEKVAKCKEVREGDMISERALKFTAGLRDVVKDTVEFITERMMLRKESWVFDKLLADMTADGQPASVNAAAKWDAGSGAELILGDMADAITRIKNAGHIKADTMLIGSDGENAIAKADTLVTWNLAGQFGQQQIAEFAVGKLKSLDIYVTDAVVTEDADQPLENENVSLIPLIADKALVFKRGADLGFIGVAESFQSRQFPVEDRRGIELQMWQSYIPVITRPTHITQITDLMT